MSGAVRAPRKASVPRRTPDAPGMALNELPDGPILLRDVDFNTASFLHNAGPHSKLAKIHEIIDRYPTLQWILVGDSGQIDAELYAQTVVKYPGRVLAVYIRDIDPTADSTRDKFVDTQIQQIASSKVPMVPSLSAQNMALAVIATTGSFSKRGWARIARVAASPSITGICISISTMS